MKQKYNILDNMNVEQNLVCHKITNIKLSFCLSFLSILSIEILSHIHLFI